MLIEWLRNTLLPASSRPPGPDRTHPHWRRFTPAYRRKRSIVKNVWIGSGLVMALQASPALILALLLGTTFLSFMILDETG